MLPMEEVFKRGSGLDVKDIEDTYTNMAVRFNLQNYRLFTLQSLISGDNKVKPGVDIPEYLFKFIVEQGKCLGIGNVINGKVYSVKFKSLREKEFLTVGEKRALPYGIGLLPNFKFGDWLALVEGEKDRDCLAQIYPYVVSTSTAGAGSIMKEVLKSMTNRFLIFYDNDDSGNKAYFRDRKHFLEHNCQVVRGIHPEGYKDCGSIADLLYKNDSFNMEYAKSYYDIQISNIVD